MSQRMNYPGLASEPLKLFMSLEAYLVKSGLETSLLHLVKTRVSQINGCAFCLDMHTKDARAHGETEQRLYTLSAWREAPFYTDRERAALAWAESVTAIGGGVPDDVYNEARQHFSEKELVDLTWAVVAINGWNRLAISFRTTPGSYTYERRAQFFASFGAPAGAN